MGRQPRPLDYDYDYDDMSEIRRTPPVVYRNASYDEFDVPAGVPRRRFRSFAWRFIGALAIAGAFYVIAQIALHAEARRAIVDWVTLGHGDTVQRAERTVKNWVDRLREP
jgi:hypothetical protein